MQETSAATGEIEQLPEKRHTNMVFEVLRRIPWIDLFFALILPLNLLHYLMKIKQPLLGTILPILCCLIYLAVNYFIFKKISTMVIMTAIMIALGFGTAMLHGHPTLFVIAKFFTELVMGILFTGSLLFSTPFVLVILDQETLERIPAKVKETPYYLKAWKIITLMWGVAFIITGLAKIYLKSIHAGCYEALEYFSQWPLVLILYMFSIAFPMYYWKKNVK